MFVWRLLLDCGTQVKFVRFLCGGILTVSVASHRFLAALSSLLSLCWLSFFSSYLTVAPPFASRFVSSILGLVLASRTASSFANHCVVPVCGFE